MLGTGHLLPSAFAGATKTGKAKKIACTAGGRGAGVKGVCQKGGLRRWNENETYAGNAVHGGVISRGANDIFLA